MRLWETPVPIPNTTVKTQAADGTALETVWESRWPPDQKRKTDGSLVKIEQASEVSFVGTKRRQKRFDKYGANLYQPGRAVDNWFYQ